MSETDPKGDLPALIETPQLQLARIIASPDNRLLSPAHATSIISRRELKAHDGVFVARGTNDFEAGSIRDDDRAGTIWPNVDFQHYVGNIDGTTAWGKNREEAEARLSIIRGGRTSAAVTTLQDHFRGRNAALNACPPTMDDAACYRYAVCLAETLAFMALFAPEKANLETIIGRERCIPEIVFLLFKTELEALYTQIHSIMQTVRIMASENAEPETLKSVCSTLFGTIRDRTIAFVQRHSDQLLIIHHIALDDETAHFSKSVAELFVPSKR